jgi:hypothetical protein
MDLENELRQAMADHVTEMSAPRTLAADAKRRHHRTVRRRAAFAVGAAGVVAAVAMIPAYQSFRPETVGADGPGGQQHRQQTTGTGTRSASSAPTTPSVLSSPSAGSNGAHSSGTPKPSADVRSSASSTAKALLGYLPPGIDPAKTCQTAHTGSKETTTCRWTGSGGWVEVRLVRDSGLKVPSDLGLAPPTSKRIHLGGRSALRSVGPAITSQVMWIQRHGLGVWVGVSPSLNSSLIRVAESVSVS